MQYEPVIGLEVHAQLRTRSKVFCGCSTRFGAPPNSQTCPVCLGLPGSLPVVNGPAVEMAVTAGLALGCRINRRSLLARKNYFYPDLPKGYQISQYEEPLAVDGRVGLLTLDFGAPGNRGTLREFSVEIIRVHLEEDAGKSIHAARQDTQVNLNRCGVPLMEIVTHPDLRSGREASDFLDYLRRVLLYLALCDGNMEEGSLRCDANISVRPLGETSLGTKTEIKNLNSFRFLNKALDYEIQRQIRVLESGRQVVQETRLWEEDLEETRPMRSKEEAHDYRYFPDPDLLPVVISAERLDELRKDLPELPGARARRFGSRYGLDQSDALVATRTPEFADYFEASAKSAGNPKTVLNWMVGDLTHRLRKDGLGLHESPVKTADLGGLVRLLDDGAISGKMAKDVFGQMYETGKSPRTIVREQKLAQISDRSELETVVSGILESHADAVERYRNGKRGLLGFFVGQVMRQTRGQANPKMVNELLRKMLDR